MSSKLFLVIVVLGMIEAAVSSPALSQEKPIKQTTFDLNTVDCRTLLKMSGDERKNTVVFYHGILTGMNKETTVDVSKLSEITDKVVDQCIDKPNAVLLKVFQENRK